MNLQLARPSRFSWLSLLLLTALLLALGPAACGRETVEVPDAGSLPDASLPDADVVDASLPDASLPDVDGGAGDDAGVADGGPVDPFPASPPIFISAFTLSTSGAVADGAELWIDLRVASAAGLGALGGWSLHSASGAEVALQLSASQAGFPLADGEIVRVHGAGYAGSTDQSRSDNNPELWDVVAAGAPSREHGLLWLEAADGQILDAVFYTTGLNPGGWLTGTALAAADEVIGAGQWSSTASAAAVALGDAEAEWARVFPAHRRAGNLAGDWEILGDTFGGYYASAEGKTGEELKAALSAIIHHDRMVTYTAAIQAFKQTDPDPSTPGNVLCFYSGQSMSTGYNREHVWAKSHGGFEDIEPAYNDLHHLRPTRIDINSKRWHLDFAEGGELFKDSGCRAVTDLSFEPRDEGKGEVARTLFYMAVRYEGADPGIPDLELVEAIPSLLNAQGEPDNGNHVETPTMGRLSELLQWHLDDPPDPAERTRNDVIQRDYQGNRNPFVDHPEWVAEIFGGPAWPAR